MIYLYAIIDQPRKPLPAIGGLDGMCIDLLAYRSIGAVINAVATTKIATTEANLWQHEAIVEGVMAAHAVLPVRFGTLLADQYAVRTVLKTYYAGFKANLARVRDHVELGVRIMWDDDEPPSPSPIPSADFSTFHDGGNHQTMTHPGRSYILTRLQEQRRLDARCRRVEAFAANIHAPLARQATKSTHKIRFTPHIFLTAAYLVHREQVEMFKQEMESLMTAHPELRFSCTGPWPPYHFVTQSIGGNGNALLR